MSPELASAAGIAAAALGGAAVGVERQWSGHASGPAARFAGVRTFTLLGGLGGLAGWLWSGHYELLAAVVLASAGALVVAAYVAASRHNVDGTTEVAALVVLAAGLMAGSDHLALASGVIALTDVILLEKSRLHAIVARLDDAELRAGARFAVMAVVILPLLPVGPYGPLGGVRPRELWALVLLFAGLNFAGYIARRTIGAQRGYPVTGLLGGFISSTSVTWTFARVSRGARAPATALAAGVMAASAMMFLRVLLATAILNWALAAMLVPYLVAPFAVGAFVSIAGARGVAKEEPRATTAENPLQFWAALQMATLFQIVLFAVYFARDLWGGKGLLVSGAVLGLTDVDALTLAMARSTAHDVAGSAAAQAVAIGMLTNTLLKLGLALAIGRARFRRLAGGSLAAMAAAAAASIALLR